MYSKFKLVFGIPVLVSLLLVAKVAEAQTVLKSYACSDGQSGNAFALAESSGGAQVTGFSGEDLYEGGLLKLLTKQAGFMAQTQYQMPSGALLTISEHVLIGRGGCGRGSCDNDFGGHKIISAKISSHEKDFYFSCY